MYRKNCVDNTKINIENSIKFLEYYYDIEDSDKVSECIDPIKTNFYKIDLEKLKTISKKLGFEFILKIYVQHRLKTISC